MAFSDDGSSRWLQGLLENSGLVRGSGSAWNSANGVGLSGEARVESKVRMEFTSRFLPPTKLTALLHYSLNIVLKFKGVSLLAIDWGLSDIQALCFWYHCHGTKLPSWQKPPPLFPTKTSVCLQTCCQHIYGFWWLSRTWSVAERLLDMNVIATGQESDLLMVRELETEETCFFCLFSVDYKGYRWTWKECKECGWETVYDMSSWTPYLPT